MEALKNILLSINFEDKRIQSTPDWEKLAECFNIDYCIWSEDTRLKAYHVKTWLCTDTWVGWEAYFLDGQLVCVSLQDARKADKNFQFISKEIAFKVRDYLIKLVNEEEELHINILDLGLEVAERYKIEYNSQILHKTAWFGLEKVKIKRTRYEFNSAHYFHTVEIENEKGEVLEVDCRKLEFEYNNLD